MGHRPRGCVQTGARPCLPLSSSSAPSLPQMLLLGKGPNAHPYRHPRHLPRSPPPESPSWANTGAGRAALWWTGGPPLGRGPWGGGQSPCRDGMWHLLTSFSSAHSPYHRGHCGHGRSVHPVVPGRLLHVSSCHRPRSGSGPERPLPLKGRRGPEQGGDRAWGPGPWALAREGGVHGTRGLTLRPENARGPSAFPSISHPPQLARPVH